MRIAGGLGQKDSMRQKEGKGEKETADRLGRMDKREKPARRVDSEKHTCRKEKLKLRHWFGESDASEEESSEEEEDWTQVEREKKRKEKIRRNKEKR